MFDVVALPPCWPVEVNYHEAKAYCAWRGPHFRLLAEAEYHALTSPPPVTPLLLGRITCTRCKDSASCKNVVVSCTLCAWPTHS